MKWLIILLILGQPAFGQARYELDNSLRDRAKWKSLGVEDWVTGDPMERARSGRGRIAKSELSNLKGDTAVDQLKSLIAVAEAGPKGFDAVHTQAGQKPPKRPTEMTLREIARWVRATPGQPHAIGRYQIIPATMRALIQRSGVSSQATFSPALQDHFADILLADAGLADFQIGRISKKQFMNNLAKIWAGLPTSSGKSYYDGYAGNRATVTLRYFTQQMDRFWPDLR